MHLFKTRRVKIGIAVFAMATAGLVSSQSPAQADLVADSVNFGTGFNQPNSTVDTTSTVGVPDAFTVEVHDGIPVATNYTGTVTFTATGADPACDNCFTISPNNGTGHEREYTYSAENDKGIGHFTIVWAAPGSDRTLKVSAEVPDGADENELPDTVTAQETVDIAAPTASHVSFDSSGPGAVNKTPVVGETDLVTVALRNQFDDIDTGYTGQINWDSSTCGSRFTVNDQPSSTPYTFVAGDHGAKTFNIKWTDVAPNATGCKLAVEATIPDGEPSTDEVTGIKPTAPPATTTTTVAPTTTTTAPSQNLPHIQGALVTGAMAPGGPHVKVWKASTRELQREFFAYDLGFKGGVNVALGDINNDGWTDIVTGAGPGGGSHVKVFSGKNGSVIGSFFAYPVGYNGGVYVAAADVNNDGKDDVITGVMQQGGPHVKVFSGNAVIGEGYTGADSGLLASFYAYSTNPAFTGGVRVAGVDADGDGKAEVITGAGPGGGPHVAIFKPGASLGTRTVVNEWFAYGDTFTGGIYVGAHEQGGTPRIITGAGPGGGQHVRVWNTNGTEIAGVIPQATTVGATVALGNADADGADEFVVGNASGAPSLRVFDLPATEQGTQSTNVYAGFAGGINVALGDI